MNIYSGTFNNSIYGGYSHAGGKVHNNTVIIDGGTFNGGTYVYILGGYSTAVNADTGDVNDNIVTINGGIFHRRIYGGYSSESGRSSSNGDANNNMLIINDGTLDSGGYWCGFCGGYGKNATGNTITITSGNFEYGYIYGGYAWAGDASNNVVNIYGGNFSSNIYGAEASYGESKNNTINIYGSPNLSSVGVYGSSYGYKGTVSDNVLNIFTRNLTIGSIGSFENINFYLPESTVNGDTILTLTSGSNTNLSNTNVTAIIQGGSTLTNGDIVNLIKNEAGVTEAQSYTGTLAEGVSLTYPMTVKRANDGNRIILGIGDFIEDEQPEPDPEPTPTIIDDSNNIVNVYNSDSGNIYGGNTDTGNAQNNIINLYGGTNLENIYGGYAPNGSTSGNTLNVRAKGLTANNIYNFDNLNFYIPKDTINGDTLLTLTDTNGTNLNGVAIKAGVVAGNTNLQIGDTINLLTNSNGLTTTGTTYGKLTEGVSLNYDMNISHAGNSIVANITQSPNNLNPETESLPLSSGIPAIETVNTSFDTPTIEEKKENAEAMIVDSRGWEVFANMGGGSLKIKGSDGAHVDMTSQSINLGFARSLENSPSSLIIAPVFDYVSSNYDSYLEMGTHGSGKTRYIAGGLLLRRMLQNGFYYEGSVRVGKVKTDFSSDNLDKTGVFGRVTYDASATTLAGHLKIGKAFRLNKNNFLDVYGIYYHAHQGGMDADLSSGEHYNFSSANSGRFRIGYRLTTKTSNISKIYTGLAYQYENSSGVTATYKNYSTAGTGNSGSSGMLEVGWIVRPLKALPWAVDINTTGWIGHQRGITAMAKIQKAF